MVYVLREEGVVQLFHDVGRELSIETLIHLSATPIPCQISLLARVVPQIEQM